MSSAHESGFEAKFRREGISSSSAFVATRGLQAMDEANQLKQAKYPLSACSSGCAKPRKM